MRGRSTSATVRSASIARLVSGRSRMAGLGSRTAWPPPRWAIVTAIVAAVSSRLVAADAPVDLHDGDAGRPARLESRGDLVEGAAPAHAEGARHRAQGGQVVGGGLGDPGGGLGVAVGRRDDHGIGQAEPLAQLALEPEAAGARMDDLDPDDPALPGLGRAAGRP